jgi:hypothetical protein
MSNSGPPKRPRLGASIMRGLGWVTINAQATMDIIQCEGTDTFPGGRESYNDAENAIQYLKRLERWWSRREGRKQ